MLHMAPTLPIACFAMATALLASVANAGDGTIAVLVNPGAGSFAAPVYYPSGDTPNSLGACDVDADNDLDIVVNHSNEDSLAVFLNQGDVHLVL